MAGPIMNRPRSHDPVFLVIIRPVKLERLDALAATLDIKPALGKHHSNRLDAVLDPLSRRHMNRAQPSGFQAKIFQNLDATDAGSQFTSRGIVGQDMVAVDVASLD